MKKLTLPFRVIESELNRCLTPKEMDYIDQHVSCLEFNKKENVYAEDQQGEAVFLLAKGSVKLSNFLDEGKELIKYIVQPGEVFGEAVIMGMGTRDEIAVAVRDNVQVWKIPVHAIEKVMESNHLLSFYFIELIQSRLQSMERRLGSFISKNARSRIVDFIKYNAETRGKQIGYEILINQKLTHQDIANITGTSRQTVTSVLNELKRSNLIYFNGMGILVRDIAALA